MSLFDPQNKTPDYLSLSAFGALVPRNRLMADVLYPPTATPPPVPSAFNGLVALNAFSGDRIPTPLGNLPTTVSPPPARRRVFISFQSEDLWAVELLREIARQPSYDLDFYDESLKVPFDSIRADYIRNRLLDRIERTSVTICLIGRTTYESAWVDWEIFRSLEKGNKIIAMGIPGETHLTIPRMLRQVNAPWHVWDIDYLKQQIASAPKPKPHSP